MKRQIISILSAIVLLLLLCSGALVDIVRFFAWLFALQYSHPDTSIAGGIIVRVLTFVVSYSLVGIIFNALKWFNGKAMKIVYFIISTLLGFVIAYIVWNIEQHILIIGIVMGVIVLAAIAYYVIRAIVDKKKQPKLEEDEDE